MRFDVTDISGPRIIELQAHVDERGFFARSFCVNEFAAQGINFNPVQMNVSFNSKRGTLRGMHFQRPPHEEAKIVSCMRGAIYDVVIDLRRGSPTFKRSITVELTAENHRALYVPAGFAHGFQSLSDATEVLYVMSEFYAPDAALGVRYNDIAFGVAWPIDNPIISQRDASYPDFRL
jgi:dTDP-4-dehydrorhamnose 3,5-epimerase